jgi:PAS domain S-box-containing protein
MMKEDMDDLEISRFELQKVADFLPYPFIIAEVIDNVHLNTHLNEKFLEEIGYTIEEIPTIGKWYEKAYPDEEYRKNVIRLWDQEEIECQQKGKVFVKMKSYVTRKDGSRHWYEIKASVINKVHVVAFIDLDKEITFQEELKSINRNNDRMLSILGHDLRSPIANLTSVSSMALDSEISESEFKDFIFMIKEQSIQVLEMLDTTLNWAKLNFNSISEQHIEIDVKSLIVTVLEIYKISYESKNITVDFVLDGSPKIHSDLEIVTIIVRNIISNAIKFTPQNGKIYIKFNQSELTISDNGIGMTPEMIHDILNHNCSSRKGTNDEIGIGMGLQLVLSLAEKINCKVLLESESSKGTRIRLIF